MINTNEVVTMETQNGLDETTWLQFLQRVRDLCTPSHIVELMLFMMSMWGGKFEVWEPTFEV